MSIENIIMTECWTDMWVAFKGDGCNKKTESSVCLHHKMITMINVPKHYDAWKSL